MKSSARRARRPSNPPPPNRTPPPPNRTGRAQLYLPSAVPAHVTRNPYRTTLNGPRPVAVGQPLATAENRDLWSGLASFVFKLRRLGYEWPVTLHFYFWWPGFQDFLVSALSCSGEFVIQRTRTMECSFLRFLLYMGWALLVHGDPSATFLSLSSGSLNATVSSTEAGTTVPTILSPPETTTSVVVLTTSTTDTATVTETVDAESNQCGRKACPLLLPLCPTECSSSCHMYNPDPCCKSLGVMYCPPQTYPHQCDNVFCPMIVPTCPDECPLLCHLKVTDPCCPYSGKTYCASSDPFPTTTRTRTRVTTETVTATDTQTRTSVTTEQSTQTQTETEVETDTRTKTRYRTETKTATKVLETTVTSTTASIPVPPSETAKSNVATAPPIIPTLTGQASRTGWSLFAAVGLVALLGWM
ncbi:uncharacterized protein VTP21DRAFT_9170 [Calcarisporiella thermophila]|uniref:uncharacterized protein n=1 Tax=Calcarisporiella thermophila TaxID=911321 RepID=UPI0037432572